ncbi:MAG: arginine repressor [Christensenellales bacterium]|jgi:transcriptional regulator of arginine metabolism
MKSKRHNLILELVRTGDISTQEELAEALKKHSVIATQATISRDIKELRLIKVLGENGMYKYAKLEQNDSALDARLLRLFSESVLSMQHSGNIIVLHTISGTANAAAEAIDNLSWEELMGSLAGDDTIFVLIRSEQEVQAVLSRFRQMMQ